MKYAEKQGKGANLNLYKMAKYQWEVYQQPRFAKRDVSYSSRSTFEKFHSDWDDAKHMTRMAHIKQRIKSWKDTEFSQTCIEGNKDFIRNQDSFKNECLKMMEKFQYKEKKEFHCCNLRFYAETDELQIELHKGSMVEMSKTPENGVMIIPPINYSYEKDAAPEAEAKYDKTVIPYDKKKWADKSDETLELPWNNGWKCLGRLRESNGG